MTSSTPHPVNTLAVSTIVGASIALIAACGGGATARQPELAPAPRGQTAAQPVVQTDRLPADIAPATVARGDSLFNHTRCARCHGQDGVGATDGSPVNTATFKHTTGTFADLVRIITEGVPGSSGVDMPPRGGSSLTDDQIRAVAAYVWTLNHHA